MSDAGATLFIVSFALYTLAIVGVGLYSARFAKRSDEDYFLAGRSLGPVVAALSASASAESGWVTLGLVGVAFSTGYAAYWIIPGIALGYMFNWFVLAARLRDASAGTDALTIPDFFSFHFRERFPLVRILSVLVILVAMWLYVAAQFAAAGKAFHAAFAGIDYWEGTLIGAGVVLVYTVLGGFRAACWTDFLQGLLMIGVLVGFPVYLLFTEGGFGFISDALAQAEGPDGEAGGLVQFLPNKSGLAFVGFLLGAGALGINFGYPGQPHVLIRYMALRDRKEAIVGGTIAMIWMVAVLWGAVTIGLLARAMTEGGAAWGAPLLEDGELALVVAAGNMLPAVIAGAVLAAILAAICSTADSQLVVAASAAANDVYARIFQHSTKKSHTFINRAVLFTLGVGALVLVVNQEVQVYTYVLNYGWAVLGAAFGPQLILAILWRRATYAGCLAGMATGFAVAIGWEVFAESSVTIGGQEIEVYNLPLAFVLALIVNAGVSLVTAPPSAPGGPASEVDAS